MLGQGAVDRLCIPEGGGLSLGPLARLARAHILHHVDILARPEGQALHKQPHLGPAKVSAEPPVVALVTHLLATADSASSSIPRRFPHGAAG